MGDIVEMYDFEVSNIIDEDLLKKTKDEEG